MRAVGTGLCEATTAVSSPIAAAGSNGGWRLPHCARPARRAASMIEPMPRILNWCRLSSLVLFLVVLPVTDASAAGILSEADLRKVDEIRLQFQSLLTDLVQTSKRGDLVGGDSECLKAATQELLQISGELSSYEYLMTIEKEMKDVGDDSPVRGAIRFAVEKSSSLLTIERGRFIQLSDQCRRSLTSYGKTQDALRVIDTTIGLLNSIQLRP
jgi:hypothetical protein